MLSELNVSGHPVLVACYECADGVPLDPARVDDARLIGEALATLHQSMRQVQGEDRVLMSLEHDGAHYRWVRIGERGRGLLFVWWWVVATCRRCHRC